MGSGPQRALFFGGGRNPACGTREIGLCVRLRVRVYVSRVVGTTGRTRSLRAITKGRRCYPPGGGLPGQ